MVDSHYYTQITAIRTIEQILGIKPMNQKDSAATPMFGAFTQQPDFTPFTTVPNQTSLTAGLKELPTCGADVQATQNPAAAPAPAATVPAGQQAVAAQWDTWKSQQLFNAPNPKPDSASPVLMNHFDWYQAHDWSTPYPGEDKIFAPNDVPGAVIPGTENDG